MRGCGIYVLLLAASMLTSDVGLSQQAIQLTEHELKAAFIYNFAKFTDWPDRTNTAAPLVMGVLGTDAIEDALRATLKDKTIEGRPLLIHKPGSAAEARTNCHILFISSSEQERLAEILNDLAGASVLTVAEMEQFTERGGMIRFVPDSTPQGTKIRFQINDQAAKKAGLTFRSKLRHLAVNPAK